MTYAAYLRAGVAGGLVRVGRWLEEIHPHSLVELDYGGLVHLASDDALCGDQSVAVTWCPSSAMRIASRPVPQPRSIRRLAGGYVASSQRHISLRICWTSALLPRAPS